MKYIFISILTCLTMTLGYTQNNITPEKMWQLGRVTALGISVDKQYIIYKVSVPDMANDKIDSKLYKISINGGKAVAISTAEEYIGNDRISPNGKYILSTEEVLLKKIMGADRYKDLPKTTGMIFTELNFRHWDRYQNGKYSHVFYAPYINGVAGEKIDIMKEEPYYCPQQPFGGNEDFIWSPDSEHIIYVTKKKEGTAYAQSTNTDIYSYNIKTGITTNLTEKNKGYDVAPAFSKQGVMAWLQMKRDGYEADKQDIAVLVNNKMYNLTAHNDAIHVENFKWNERGDALFFTAPINGTQQLFTVPFSMAKNPEIKQITHGDFNITSVLGQVGNAIFVMKESFNRAGEIYKVDLTTGALTPLTTVNDEAYNNIAACKVERKFYTTTDNKQMLTWVVYPPNFDAGKKYPTILYCEGGPQSALTQFYSFRWNIHLIASQGYIVVLPSRRGMPGFGTQWNESISKDWGGQVMKDYLTAIDNISKEKYVDVNRRAAIGASFGGYSVFQLQGIHNGRFKTFISHNGVFDFVSMFGTTDEMWFENWEKGGSYWDKNNKVAQRSFNASPSYKAHKWNTPIYIIQCEKDYRVPLEQGLQAFKLAQMKGIKSKILIYPDENHWVLKPQNALLWQREFFNWLEETL